METITCVYCGHAFPAETPAHGAPILREHIRTCPQHPMREAEEKISILRRALVGLVGVDGADQLNEMEAIMRLMPAPMADKAASIDAIHALRTTLPADHPPRRAGGGAMKNDIIQITDESHPWFPALLIVDEERGWGVLATCLIPASNVPGSRCDRAPIRLETGRFVAVGKAWIAPEVAHA